MHYVIIIVPGERPQNQRVPGPNQKEDKMYQEVMTKIENIMDLLHTLRGHL